MISLFVEPFNAYAYNAWKIISFNIWLTWTCLSLKKEWFVSHRMSDLGELRCPCRGLWYLLHLRFPQMSCTNLSLNNFINKFKHIGFFRFILKLGLILKHHIINEFSWSIIRSDQLDLELIPNKKSPGSFSNFIFGVI